MYQESLGFLKDYYLASALYLFLHCYQLHQWRSVLVVPVLEWVLQATRL